MRQGLDQNPFSVAPTQVSSFVTFTSAPGARRSAETLLSLMYGHRSRSDRRRSPRLSRICYLLHHGMVIDNELVQLTSGGAIFLSTLRTLASGFEPASSWRWRNLIMPAAAGRGSKSTSAWFRYPNTPCRSNNFAESGVIWCGMDSIHRGSNPSFQNRPFSALPSSELESLATIEAADMTEALLCNYLLVCPHHLGFVSSYHTYRIIAAGIRGKTAIYDYPSPGKRARFNTYIYMTLDWHTHKY